jgi:sodium/proline symporter
MPQSTTISVTFIAYLIAMLLIGIAAWQRTRDLSDYILGGRRLGKWVTALSAGASDMSGWLLLGLPGFAYATGVQAGWIALGLLVGTWLNWRLVAGRLRIYTQVAGNTLTIPAFLERRFLDDGHLLRTLSGLLILLFYLSYTAAGLVAGGKLFNAVFGMPYEQAVIAGALAIVMYVLLGGFLAVSWTDVVQATLMALALLLVPLMGLVTLGGWHAGLDALRSINPELLNPFTDIDGLALTPIAIISLLGWGLGYFGQPHILARFKAIHDVRSMPAARRIAMTWVLITLTGALAVGLAGIPLVEPALHGADTEKVFINLVSLMFHPVIAGICLAAILAAIMSTADSQLLVASATLAEDFHKALLHRGAGRAELMWIGRGAVLLVSAAACVLALEPDSKVLDLVAYAWAGFGGAFGPAILMALYWRRMTRRGALAGILAGGATVVIWKQFDGGWFDVYELVPAFILSMIAIVIFSLLDRLPELDIEREFDRVQRTMRER